MKWLISIVGLKRILLAIAVLVAIGAGYWTIQFIQDTGKDEIRMEQLENEVDTRERIDRAIERSPSDRDGALGVLRDFLQ